MYSEPNFNTSSNEQQQCLTQRTDGTVMLISDETRGDGIYGSMYQQKRFRNIPFGSPFFHETIGQLFVVETKMTASFTDYRATGIKNLSTRAQQLVTKHARASEADCVSRRSVETHRKTDR